MHVMSLYTCIQLSTVSDLLSQLVSADREALMQDTDTLRETIATLQAQLQQLQVCEHTSVTMLPAMYMYTCTLKYMCSVHVCSTLAYMYKYM